jgi:hypothetical protein
MFRGPNVPTIEYRSRFGVPDQRRVPLAHGSSDRYQDSRGQSNAAKKEQDNDCPSARHYAADPNTNRLDSETYQGQQLPKRPPRMLRRSSMLAGGLLLVPRSVGNGRTMIYTVVDPSRTESMRDDSATLKPGRSSGDDEIENPNRHLGRDSVPVCLTEHYSDPPKRVWLVMAVVLTSAALIYYVGITPERFGGMHDDSMYVTCAKALATGQGYTIVSLPNEPAQTKYPPLYSSVLSVVWRAYPRFPQNITPTMLLSAVLTLVFLTLTWLYLYKFNYAAASQAVLIITLAAFNVCTFRVATTILSEMLFAALTVTGLYLAEQYEDRGLLRSGVVLGIVIGLAFLTRTTGLALLIVIAAYFGARGKWRRILRPCAIAGAFVLGWIVWCYVNRSAMDLQNAGFYTSHLVQTNEALSQAVESHQSATMLTAFLAVVARNAVNLVIALPLTLAGVNLDWIPDLGALMRLAVLVFCGICILFTSKGAFRQCRHGVRLLPVFVVTYVVSHMPFPFSGYQRYLAPVLPFLLLFLIAELNGLMSLVREQARLKKGIVTRISAAFMAVILGIFIVVGAYDYQSGVRWSLASTSVMEKKTGPPAEDRETIEWINTHTDRRDVLACERDPLYYLLTDRKTTRSFYTRGDPLFAGYQGTPSSRERDIQRILSGYGVRYVILRWTDLAPGQSGSYLGSYRELIQKNPKVMVLVFESSDGQTGIYRIDGKLRDPS